MGLQAERKRSYLAFLGTWSTSLAPSHPCPPCPQRLQTTAAVPPPRHCRLRQTCSYARSAPVLGRAPAVCS